MLNRRFTWSTTSGKLSGPSPKFTVPAKSSGLPGSVIEMLFRVNTPAAGGRSVSFGPASKVGATLNTLMVRETAEALSSREVLSVALPPSRDSVVHCTFGGAENLLYLCEPKHIELPTPSISLDTRDSEDGVVATLTSDTLALAVMLSLDGVDSEWSDNFFNLVPGEPRDIVIRPASPLTAAQLTPLLRFRTLTD